MENRSDLIDYLYIIILNIKDFDLKTRLPTRYTRIINVYDQVINRGYIYLGVYTKKRKVIEDIN